MSDDAYVRHQQLAALVAVLLHDLRNPLHGASLVVEALALRGTLDEAASGKLRKQLDKLSSVVRAVAEPAKALAPPGRAATASVSAAVALGVTAARAATPSDALVEVDVAPDLEATFDAALLAVSIEQLVTRAIEAAGPTARVRITACAEPLSLTVEDAHPVVDDLARQQPFAVLGGGLRPALARAVAESAGLALRLARADDAGSRYVFTLRA